MATTTLKQFLAQKAAIQAEFETAILKAIEAMGNDIKGVDWFCSSASRYQPSQAKAA